MEGEHMPRRMRPGYTIPAAAKVLDWPEGVVRRGVRRGEILTVPFAGLDRIPPKEVTRLKALSVEIPPRSGESPEA
jgi:hypothetical protein